MSARTENDRISFQRRNFHQNRPDFDVSLFLDGKSEERERLWWLVYTDSSRRLIGFRAR